MIIPNVQGTFHCNNSKWEDLHKDSDIRKFIALLPDLSAAPWFSFLNPFHKHSSGWSQKLKKHYNLSFFLETQRFSFVSFRFFEWVFQIVCHIQYAKFNKDQAKVISTFDYHINLHFLFSETHFQAFVSVFRHEACSRHYSNSTKFSSSE